ATLKSSSFDHSILPERMSYINNVAVRLPCAAPMISNLLDLGKTWRLRIPMPSCWESKTVVPVVTSMIACMGSVDSLLVCRATAINSVPSISSYQELSSAANSFFSHIIFPSSGFTAYRPLLVLTIIYPSEWMRCQPIGLVNLVLHPAFVSVWAFDRKKEVKASKARDKDKKRAFMILRLMGKELKKC